MDPPKRFDQIFFLYQIVFRTTIYFRTRFFAYNFEGKKERRKEGKKKRGQTESFKGKANSWSRVWHCPAQLVVHLNHPASQPADRMDLFLFWDNRRPEGKKERMKEGWRKGCQSEKLNLSLRWLKSCMEYSKVSKERPMVDIECGPAQPSLL